MRKILEQTIEINHLEYADAFHDSVRKHPAFQLPLQLRTEPTYVPLSNGDLLIISEYVSNSLNSFLLNLFLCLQISWKFVDENSGCPTC